ncbi:MAG TPA: ABC transporter ATP-binding protein [Candidatus Saccharimonadales bacterium]|nr:ABC transporter ATP-binding protein [Candidatus Saccharimonadales bacterium]
MTAAPAIDCQKLSKRYGGSETYALRDLTLNVKPGEVYGFLGPNGAGKSTTIRTLMNFIQPTSGRATILGKDAVTDSVAIKRHVGYLAGDVALYQKTTGRELLDYLFRLQGASDRAYLRKLEKRFQAEVHKPVGSLSKGNRQKLGLIQAFMHQPEVLILDEPSAGLDPLMQEAFYETLAEVRDRGVAILMSSHNLAEAQRVSDRVGIIKRGKLIHEQSISGSNDLGKPVFRVLLSRPADLPKLRQAPGLKFLSKEGEATALVQAAGTVAEALKSLSQFDIREFTTEQLNLEDEFIEFYGGRDDS